VALTAVPRTNLTFLLSGRGAPFTPKAFSEWFRRCCDEAGLRHCSAHGLRKAAATRFANLGATTDQIKAFTGHRSLSEVQRYTKAADQARLARSALALALGTDGEQSLPDHRPRLGKGRRNP
jgi:integrase